MKRPHPSTADDERARDERDEPGAPPPPEGEAEAGAPESSTPEPRAAEAIDYKDRWLRAEAELQNYRRRARRDLDDAVRRAEERVILDMIALLDDLERAVGAARDAGAADAWVQGVALTMQRGKELLARYGVEPVDPVGQPFDPNLHEAVLEVEPPAGAEPGTVTQVVTRGWRRGERAVRAARVVVARHHGGGVV